jgi:preprotein translocase subunit YajC
MLTYILLQAAGGSGLMGNLFLFGGIIIIMYFFMIRPQQKKQKDTKTFLETMKKGDDVVTIGGLHGKIHSLEGDTVMMELDKGLKVKVEKSAISLDFSKRNTPTK